MEIFTLEEVAAILKVHKLTINREIVRGNMEAAKVGGVWRISNDQLEAYFSRRTVSRKKRKTVTLA